jgi:Apoptotic protease-activating factor 1-like, winged-helix domain
VEALEEADRERYLDLAVFPQDREIPESALRAVWNLDEINARDCMGRLVTRSLAAWGAEEVALILHDLQRDLIYKQRENELVGLHLRLVEAWDALPELPDSYAWRWIGYHLVQAGRKERLRVVFAVTDQFAKEHRTPPLLFPLWPDWPDKDVATAPSAE